MLAGFADEGTHLRVTTMVVGTFHIDETRFALGGGLVEFAFGRRKAGGVFVAVFLAKQPDVNGTAPDFVEINFVGAAVGGGQILEQENVKEPPEQRVAANEITNCPALLRQFFLHAADEDAFAHG